MNQYGIVMATRIEAEPFIRGIAPGLLEKGPVRVYSGDSALVAVSGIGKVNAATAAAYLCWKYGVTHLFNCGSAGAVVEGYRVGDILHVNEVIEKDRPLPSGGTRRLRPDMFDGFPTAVLATSDRPVITDTDRLAAGKTAQIVDMEGAAVVHAGKRFSSHTYLFKIITDVPGDTDGNAIMDKIKNTSEDMFHFFMKSVLPLI